MQGRLKPWVYAHLQMEEERVMADEFGDKSDDGLYVKRTLDVWRVVRWWKNGDHPDDGVGEPRHDSVTGKDYEGIEGRVVQFFRRPEPEYAGDKSHQYCGYTWDQHGFIDQQDGEQTVCPGDYVINLVTNNSLRYVVHHPPQLHTTLVRQPGLEG